jgi:prevent-host-death family protein
MRNKARPLLRRAHFDMDQYMVHVFTMKVSISDAKAKLTDLVRRAEAGDDVILTRHGHPAVRLTPVRAAGDAKGRRELIERIAGAASARASAGPSAARSQDFLYGEDGLPE